MEERHKLHLMGREKTVQETGFTLIELIVVILILGILAGVAIFALGSLTGTSILSSCNSEVNNVQSALKTYRSQMGNYPAGVAGGKLGFRTDGDVTTVNAAGATSGIGAELLAGSEVGTSSMDARGVSTPNVSVTPSVGPWLKDLPQSSGNYYIWVMNDGSDMVLVGKWSAYPSEPPTQNTSCTAAGIG
jgi:prepilin-type N-terminal cleavage/methylation domain-containing protein